MHNNSLSSHLPCNSNQGVLNELVSLTEAYKVISKLRLKCQMPQRQLVTWKCKNAPYSYKNDNLSQISARLLMYEFQLLKKQKEIEAILGEKEQIINQQQKIITKLKRKLHENNIETADSEDTDLEYDSPNALGKIDEKCEPDNDSDSAVVMEDSDCVSECFSLSNGRFPLSNTVAISRSVSDAIVQPNRLRKQTHFTPVVSTYNRVMSNHRSVTKPKDVKYKRINKAKSKSLEELRDKLKNWLVISND